MAQGVVFIQGMGMRTSVGDERQADKHSGNHSSNKSGNAIHGPDENNVAVAKCDMMPSLRLS